MSVEQEQVMVGCEVIEEWMRERFPDVSTHRLGRRSGTLFYRWTIDHGRPEVGLRLGVLEDVLASSSILQDRTDDLDEGMWIRDAVVEDKWLILTNECVALQPPDEW